MLLALLIAATVRGPADVETLASAADAVVHARVVASTSAWAPGGNKIVTRVTLRPVDTWKGDVPAEVTVLVPGGEVGDIAQTVQGVAVFRPDEEVVVFLHRLSASTFAVERLALGKFAVGAPPGLQKRAIRDRRGLDCVGCGPEETDDLPLSDLRARVLGRARR